MSNNHTVQLTATQTGVYKVLYQENSTHIPTRENTQALYVKAEGIIEVRDFLATHYPQYNIEFIQELSQAHLDYERENVVDFAILQES